LSISSQSVEITTEHAKSRLNYASEALAASRREIGQIMKKHGLVSNYTVAQYKPIKSDSTETGVKNELHREFDQEEPYAVVVSCSVLC
jgi:putative transposase